MRSKTVEFVHVDKESTVTERAGRLEEDAKKEKERRKREGQKEARTLILLWLRNKRTCKIQARFWEHMRSILLYKGCETKMNFTIQLYPIWGG